MQQNNDRKIYVGNLPDAVNEQVLYTVFLTFGEIKAVEMPRDQGVHKHKGYGFVEFEEPEDCDQAIDNMHEAEVFGNVIKVQKARKNAGPLNKAIWEDKEYQLKHGLTDDKQQEKDEQASVEDGAAAAEEEKEVAEKRKEKSLTQYQTLYELAKAQGLDQ